MKKIFSILMVLMVCGKLSAGVVGLPTERIALPVVAGSYLVCVWDEAGGKWAKEFESYNHSGSYDFQVPAWGKWYWIGLWDQNSGQYVFGKWIGHFPVSE